MSAAGRRAPGYPPRMTLDPPREVAPGVVLVDTGYVRPRLAAAYVVRGGDSAAIVETGAASAVPRPLAALAGQGLSPGDVSHVVVTHVHLDHAGGAGEIDVIQQTDPNTYKILTKIDTAEGARTGFFVPDQDTLFVAVPHRGSQQAEVRGYHAE